MPGNHWSAGCMCPSSPDLLCCSCFSIVGLWCFLVRTLQLPALVWPLATHLSCREGCFGYSLASYTCLQQSLHLPSFHYLPWSGNFWLVSRRTLIFIFLGGKSLQTHIFNWLIINFVFPTLQFPRWKAMQLEGCRLSKLFHSEAGWKPKAKNSSFVCALEVEELSRQEYL